MKTNFQENQGKASNASLQYKSPLSYDEERFKGGVEQTTASMANTQEKPYDLWPLYEGTGHPLQQSTASRVDLDTAPMHGWTSNPTDTTPSIRSVKQGE